MSQTEMSQNQNEEILNDFAIEGELQSPQQRSMDFKSLSALTDFIHAFRITGGQFGQLSNGCWRLIYNNSEI
jgi:hypothetical protein